jgi:hypothetical protein
MMARQIAARGRLCAGERVGRFRCPAAPVRWRASLGPLRPSPAACLVFPNFSSFLRSSSETRCLSLSW